jgi:hypothetical protein
VDTFNKGPSLTGAAPPASPTKATGAMNPDQSKSSGGGTSVPGPRAAGYMKSPTKGDPKAKLGDIKGEIGATGSCATGKAC